MKSIWFFVSYFNFFISVIRGTFFKKNYLKLVRIYNLFVIVKPINCCFTFRLQFFFTIWILFHEHLQITGLQGKWEGILLTPHCHFHPLHRHLDFGWVITAESSPLHIASSRTRIGNLWFLSASRSPLGYWQ